MDADKHIVSLTKRPICTMARVICALVRVSVLTPFAEYFFQQSTGGAAHASRKAADYLAKGER